MEFSEEQIQKYKLLMEEEEGREISLEDAMKYIRAFGDMAQLAFDAWWIEPGTQKKYRKTKS